MESALNESVQGMRKQRGNSSKKLINGKSISISFIIIIALIVAAISYYQANHFNAQIKINGINVSGLTAEEALAKLQTTEIKNTVYVGQQQILDGNDTKMGFTDEDLSGVKKLLKDQWTIFPSSKEKNYPLMPNKQDTYRSQVMKKQVEEKLLAMNKDLTAPKDAAAILQQGNIIVTKSIDGKQFDVASLLKDYEKHEYTSEIRLDPLYIQPIKEDSPIVKNQEKKLQALLQQTVDYKVQDKVHSLKASELIKNASVTKDLKVTIDPADLKNKIAEINSSQSTLNKNFTFKTHSGKVISVKGKGYGWALNVDKETAQIKAAFENGEKSIDASNISGHGWKGEGYGYDTTENNGIGDTYAEVSIKEQRIWIYKNGKLVFTTHVVTGKNSTGENTDPGVWYILYKRKDDILNGSRVGSGEYAVKVDYWVPFNNNGEGFHDASWRTNWSSNAYLNAGSGGCVNVPPSVMKKVFDNLSTYDPVVVY